MSFGALPRSVPIFDELSDHGVSIYFRLLNAQRHDRGRNGLPRL